jgi:hypothetical protein
MTTFDDAKGPSKRSSSETRTCNSEVNARRNKLLGLWAAGVMDKSGADAEGYAKEVVLADFEKPGDDNIVQKLVKDLAASDPLPRRAQDDRPPLASQHLQRRRRATADR